MAMNLVEGSFLRAAPLYAPPRRKAPMPKRHAVFLDKDGTLLDDLPYNVDPNLMRFAPGAREGLRLLGTLDYRLIVVSNQPGVALRRFPESALKEVEARLRQMFAECGATLTAFRYCPHAPHPQGRVACVCRKPMPGMLRTAAREFGVKAAGSWMIGDILDDVEAGRRAGCRTILLANGHETVWQPGPLRSPHHLVHDFAAAARIIAETCRQPSTAGGPVRA